jgi:CRP/FNR family cyclic AMP-dependent transcriptional regulator
MTTINILKKFSLFKDLNDTELSAIVKLCTNHHINKNEILFTEGEKAKDVRLLLSGKVTDYIHLREPWNKDISVYEAQEKVVFGWSALVPPYKYTGSAICTDDGDEICINGQKLIELFVEHPNIGFIVMRNLTISMRLWLTLTRKSLSQEWLAGSTPLAATPSPWGEPGRR